MNATQHSEYSLTLTQAIQWGEMDSFNHVNNTVYFKYFENARIAYFDKTGINQLMQLKKVGPILGSTECKFLAPLTYPDTIDICTRITAIKSKRFTMQYMVYSQQLEKAVAIGSGEIIYFDYLNSQTAEIPQEILENINHIESKRLAL
ncbi:acyl-CoA thioesterase [Aliikangiella marina]|uniref:Acyl-CoA thioesterase n=1 Tax=Aliikangiella marina TaxID=1712262 RepID=A0A545TIP8_9GAMM|nr:acyl-CoA thioesterase [Aliikangiella marina]TQV77099.1 acyl-CoA thioesterase [Aliikangiella marina]